jgi:hypothetical protein
MHVLPVDAYQSSRVSTTTSEGPSINEPSLAITRPGPVERLLQLVGLDTWFD